MGVFYVWVVACEDEQTCSVSHEIKNVEISL
jgi:hypothetical protein